MRWRHDFLRILPICGQIFRFVDRLQPIPKELRIEPNEQNTMYTGERVPFLKTGGTGTVGSHLARN